MESHAPESSQSARSAIRRRRRSTRLSVAVVLLVVAALLVAWAVADNVMWLRSMAAVAALVLGAAATKITHSELMAARLDAARERATVAREYAEITERRTAENMRFSLDMGRKIRDREDVIATLERSLVAAQGRVAEQTRKVSAEARRADAAEAGERESAETVHRLGQTLADSEERAADAIVRVSELEAELDALRAELDSWRTSSERSNTA